VSIRPDVSLEITQGRENRITGKILEAVDPIVMGCSIHQNESTAKNPHRDAVTKSNDHMDYVQKVRFSVINIASSCSLWNCSKRSKSQRKLATINPLSVEAGLEDVFVVPETTTSHSTMEVFGDPMGLSIRTISPITGANGWNGRPLMVNEARDVVPRQS
jgi:hypothetical protein